MVAVGSGGSESGAVGRRSVLVVANENSLFIRRSRNNLGGFDQLSTGLALLGLRGQEKRFLSAEMVLRILQRILVSLLSWNIHCHFEQLFSQSFGSGNWAGRP